MTGLIRASSIAIVVIALIAPRASAGSCAQWLESIADYDSAVESIVGGEPEEVLGDLERLYEARQEGNADRQAQSRGALAKRPPALRRITAPEGLSALHSNLTSYCVAADEAADAIVKRDAGLRSPAIRRVYETLLAYYEELLRVLQSHDCNPGDIEALENTIIPRIRQALAELEETK